MTMSVSEEASGRARVSRHSKAGEQPPAAPVCSRNNQGRQAGGRAESHALPPSAQAQNLSFKLRFHRETSPD